MDGKELLKEKVRFEYKTFCGKAKRMKREQENPYQLPVMRSIAKSLIRMADQKQEEDLRVFLIFPNLLEYLYARWLREENTVEWAVNRSVYRMSEELMALYGELVRKETVLDCPDGNYAA